ncbi:hypothetical protein FGO68_gene5535 [Halteria grandinella]|uniref:Uncharacterized protein n=1 Tax=Halteria grandinella TaxID=5974 RepID=A0A8J8SUD5_HALGN|nr:hypothetical protein FGO68_gene5535 [Halteria grandinella]
MATWISQKTDSTPQIRLKISSISGSITNPNSFREKSIRSAKRSTTMEPINSTQVTHYPHLISDKYNTQKQNTMTPGLVKIAKHVRFFQISLQAQR